MKLLLLNLFFLFGLPVFVVAAPPGYVCIGESSPRYFELDGRGWVPIAVNYLPLDGNGDDDDEAEFAEIEAYFDHFAQNGINAIRVWISGGFLEIEHRAEGEYDPARFRRIDRLLELAARYNVRVKFTLQHIRFIAPERTHRDGWATSTALATAFTDIDQYVSTEQGKQSYYNRAKALADHYAANPSVYAWELWNEMDAAAWRDAGWYDFTREMLPRIQTLFPDQLVTQTLGSLDCEGAENSYRRLFGIGDNRFVSLHRYLDQAERTYGHVKGDIDRLVWSAVDFARRHVQDRPVVINEIGAVEPNHSGPSKLYVRDTLGVLLHDMVFAPFFSGAAGSGSMWHWDHYIRPNGLWCHFLRFARAIEGVDPAAEDFTPFVCEKAGLRFYGLRGRTQTLVWCRNGADSWQNELVEGRATEATKNAVVRMDELVPGAKYKTVGFYDPWTDERTRERVRKGEIVLPEFVRSVVLKLTD